MTSGYAQINVQGPRSRELLQSLTIGRPVERGVPVPRRARDRHRLRARAVHPHHVPRRARLRALHPGRAGGARLRPARRRRRGVRAAPRRAEGARQPAHGEGLPRLRPRHRQHRLGRSRRGSASRSTSTSRAASSARTRCSRGRPPARWRGGCVQVLVSDPEPLLFHAERSCAATASRSATSAPRSYGHTLGGAVGLAMIEAGAERRVTTGSGSTPASGPSRSPAMCIPAARLVPPAVRPRQPADQSVIAARPASAGGLAGHHQVGDERRADFLSSVVGP